MQSRMYSTRIYQMSKSHLMNITQPLINRVRYDLQNQWMINSNKTINRIIDDLANCRHCCCVFVKDPERAGGKSTIGGVNKLHLRSSSNKQNKKDKLNKWL